jgi:ABC-2 type transport system permease protein
MRNSIKVAKWEVKRNMKNKSFIIGIFLTPLLIVGFMLLGELFGDSSGEETGATTVYINDEVNLFSTVEKVVKANDLSWEVKQTDISEEEVRKKLQDTENTAYLFINKEAIDDGKIPAYTSEEIDPYFMDQAHLITAPIQALQMKELGLSDQQLAVINRGITIQETAVGEPESPAEEASGSRNSDRLKRIIPGAFAGFIMLSIVFTGMAIFQSASQEKKDKIAEIILSSLTPAELMQGKIIGYFALGILQSIISLVILLPVISWRFDLEIVKYLFVPELALYIAIAILGYLLFAAIFVGIGATMSDMTTAGNFQGMVMMLPFLPFLFISPVISDPSGLMAKIGTYIPFTSPGVLLLRLTLLEEWPWLEIAISLTVLIISVLLFIILAGKIFKVGILMYGKNASPAEIWKWIRA